MNLKLLALIFGCILSAQLYAKNELPADVKQALMLENYSAALPRLRALSQQHNTAATYQLAICYLNGKGTAKSLQQAVRLLESIKNESARASFVLANLYLKGDQLTEDKNKGLELLQHAAEMDYSPAITQLRKSSAVRQNSSHPPAQTQRLFELAILTGNLAEATRQYNAGASVSYPDQNGDQPLIKAIKNKRQDVASWLISQGADLNARDAQQNTPLVAAIELKLPHIVGRLLSKKANPNLAGKNNILPLIAAITSRQQDIVNRLLSSDVDKNVANAEGVSARTLATQNKIRLDQRTQKSDNKRVANLQVKFQREQISKLIADKKSNFYQWPPLMVAIAQGHKSLANSMAKKTSLVAMKTPNNVSLIELSSTNKFDEIARDAFTQEVKSGKHHAQWYIDQLSIAIRLRNDQLFELILNKFPNLFEEKGSLDNRIRELIIQSKNNHYLFALLKKPTVRPYFDTDKLWFDACQSSTSNIVIGLAGTFLKLDRRDTAGRSCLWYATRRGMIELTRQLLDLGADPDLADNEGSTPLLESINGKCTGCLKMLLSKVHSPDKTSADGNSALMLAAKSQPEMLQILIRTGKFEIEQRNQSSMTALMIAVSNRCVDCVKLLVQADANPNRKNNRDENSFDLAAGDKEILSILEQY